MAEDNECYSKVHDEATIAFPGENKTYSVNTHTIVTSTVFENIQSVCGEVRRKSGKRVCMACIKYTEQKSAEKANKRKASQSPPQPSTSKRLDQTTRVVKITFEDISTAVSELDFSEEELVTLMSKLGSRIGSALQSHILKNCPTVNYGDMGSKTASEFLKETYPPLQSFFLGLESGAASSAHKRPMNERYLGRIERLTASAVEICYSIVNQQYISLFNLAEMLFIYFLSSSNRAAVAHGRPSGSGGIAALQSAINKISEEKPYFPSEGYVIVAIDNNQKLGKTYHISLENKYKASVVTAVTAFKVLRSTNYQKEAHKFGLWHGLDAEKKKLLAQKMIDFSNRSSERVLRYMEEFLSDRMKSALSQVPGLEPRSREGIKISKYVTPAENYCEIYDQTCVPVNPNSYAGVQKVFDHLLKLALGNSRSWVTVVCDGLPYYLGQEIIKKFVTCTICQEGVNIDNVNTHYEEVHQERSPTEKMEQKYSRILLRPGAGHYEMNAMKAIFSMWFPLFIEPIAELMGWKSQKAKTLCKAAVDHHKSWELLQVNNNEFFSSSPYASLSDPRMLLQIVFEAIIDELIHSYISTKTLDPDFEPSPSDFLNEVANSPNTVAKVAMEFALHWTFPLLLFRGAIRNCNFQASIMAREEASVIFYADRHPKYQRINCLDVAELQMMDAKLRDDVYKESLLIPNSTGGQGIDFLLEQRNKVMKKFVICSGVPTTDQWIKASSSIQTLEKVISSVETRLEMPYSTSSYKVDHTDEVAATRKYFREQKYCHLFLTATQAKDLEGGFHVEALSCLRLLNYKQQALENRNKYYLELITSGSARITAYMTKAKDGQDISALTVADLRKGINDMAASLPQEDRQRLTKGRSKLNKAGLVIMYKSIQDFVSEIPENHDDIE